MGVGGFPGEDGFSLLKKIKGLAGSVKTLAPSGRKIQIKFLQA